MILDILFPKFCLNCNKYGRYICSSCKSRLKRLPADVCPVCNMPSSLGFTHRRCASKTNISGVLSIFEYDFLMKKIIKAIKYRFMYGLYTELFSVIQEEDIKKFITVLQKSPHPVMQPVPLHAARHNWRGFNQSLLLAEFFSSSLEIPIVDGIKRIKNTPPQAFIHSKKLRKENIKNAFRATANIFKEKTVFIVDDVFTSGTTTNEMARLIRSQKSGDVYVFSLAHGSLS